MLHPCLEDLDGATWMASQSRMGNTNSDQLDDCDGRDEAPSVALRPLRSTDVMGYENEADILDHWSHVLSLNINNNLLVMYKSNK